MQRIGRLIADLIARFRGPALQPAPIPVRVRRSR
jgi:hypothetical protein